MTARNMNEPIQGWNQPSEKHSDTPRTDALHMKFLGDWHKIYPLEEAAKIAGRHADQAMDLARQLERELASAIERERLANMRADQAEEARNAAVSATERSIRLDECRRIMEALDKYPHASDYGPPIQERMRDLDRTKAGDQK